MSILAPHEDDLLSARIVPMLEPQDVTITSNLSHEQDWLILRRRCELCKQRKVSDSADHRPLVFKTKPHTYTMSIGGEGSHEGRAAVQNSKRSFTRSVV
jgi:hypothetical protein